MAIRANALWRIIRKSLPRTWIAGWAPAFPRETPECLLVTTKRTCRADLTMSVDGGRAEVVGTPQNRRE